MVRWIAVLFLCVSAAVQAELTIEITGGGENAIPIAVAPFKASGVAVPEDVAAIISADLYRSGRFRPMPERRWTHGAPAATRAPTWWRCPRCS